MLHHPANTLNLLPNSLSQHQTISFRTSKTVHLQLFIYMNPPHKVVTDFQPKELFLTNIPSYPRPVIFLWGANFGAVWWQSQRVISENVEPRKKNYWLFFIGIFMSSLTIYISPTNNMDSRVSMPSPPNKYPKTNHRLGRRFFHRYQ